MNTARCVAIPLVAILLVFAASFQVAGDPSGQGQQVDLQTGIRAERALAKK